MSLTHKEFAVHSVRCGERTSLTCHEELWSLDEKRIHMESLDRQAAFKWSIKEFV